MSSSARSRSSTWTTISRRSRGRRTIRPPSRSKVATSDTETLGTPSPNTPRRRLSTASWRITASILRITSPAALDDLVQRAARRLGRRGLAGEAEVDEGHDRVARVEAEPLSDLRLVDHGAGAPHGAEPPGVRGQEQVLDRGGHGVP